MKAWTFGVLLLLAGALGIYFEFVRDLLFAIIQPEDTAMGGFIPSDALYYVQMARDFSLEEIIDVGYYNILGPVSLIKILGQNFDLVSLGYVIGLFWAVRELGRYAGIPTAKFAFLLLANPLVLINLLSPNKEITSVIAVIFVVAYLHSGRFSHIAVAIGFAMISKVEILALLLFFLGARKFWPKRRTLLVVVGLLCVSLLYGVLAGLGGRDQVLLEGQVESSAGIVVALHDLAMNYYMFAIVAIPRLIIDVLEGWIDFLRGGAGDLVLMVPIAWSGIMFVVIGWFVGRKKQFYLRDDSVFLFFLLALMVALVPFPHHRYLLPTYPLLVYFMLRRQVLMPKRLGVRNAQLCRMSEAHV